MLSQQVAHFNPTFPFPNLLLLSNILTRYSRSQDLNECHERTYQYRLAAAGSFCCPSPESYPPPSRLHLAINFLHFFGHPTFKHFKLWIVNLRSILNKLLSFCCFFETVFLPILYMLQKFGEWRVCEKYIELIDCNLFRHNWLSFTVSVLPFSSNSLETLPFHQILTIWAHRWHLSSTFDFDWFLWKCMSVTG